MKTATQIAMFSSWTLYKGKWRLHLRGRPTVLNQDGVLYELSVFPQTPTLWQWEVCVCGKTTRRIKGGTADNHMRARKQCRRAFATRHDAVQQEG